MDHFGHGYWLTLPLMSPDTLSMCVCVCGGGGGVVGYNQVNHISIEDPTLILTNLLGNLPFV